MELQYGSDYISYFTYLHIVNVHLDILSSC